jgi:hypothetical protein
MTKKLIKLKNAFSEFFNKYLNETLVLAVTSVAAFFVIIGFNIVDSIEKNELINENSELMIQNSILNFRDGQRIIMMDRQLRHINELERFKEAILKGNYTQNENTKQKQYKVVGNQRQKRDLDL